MKGVFNLKPPRPRYKTTWDVKIVFDYMRGLWSLSSLSLQDLTVKNCMLTALVSAQRKQTLHLLRICNMDISDYVITFHVDDLLKTSKPGNVGCTLVFEQYKQDARICVYQHLKYYLDRTQELRGQESHLYSSFRKPHQRVSRDTIGRWLKHVMANAGLNVNLFKPHSTRSAAVSKVGASLPVTDTMNHVGWRNERTF